MQTAQEHSTPSDHSATLVPLAADALTLVLACALHLVHLGAAAAPEHVTLYHVTDAIVSATT